MISSTYQTDIYKQNPHTHLRLGSPKEIVNQNDSFIEGSVQAAIFYLKP